MNCFRVHAVLAAVLLVSACATTGPARSPARIDVQQDVGFTITEKGRISGSVLADYNAALTRIEQGDEAGGLRLLETVVAAAPHLGAPRIDLGVAYHRAGQLEAAQEHLLLALESNPHHPIAHNEMGIIYRKTGRFNEARRSYQAALAIYPGYHFARRNLAVLCDLYLADLDCALDNYEAYLVTVPDDNEAAMWIADIRMRMGQTEDSQ